MENGGGREDRDSRDPRGTLSILCVITAMGCGGAERRFADLVNVLARRGHRIHLRVLDGGSSFFDLDDRVDLRFWATERRLAVMSLGRFSSRLRWLRRSVAATRPDLVLSFIDVANVMTLMATRGLRVPVVASERAYPPMNRIPVQYRLLRKRLYRKAAVVVVQTEEAALWVRNAAPGTSVEVIPNPVDKPSEDAPAREGKLPLTRRTVAAMGRLAPEKGFDGLLRAFAKIAVDHPQWNVVIFGEGPERARLEEQIEAYGFGDRVLLPGQVHGPAEALRRCGLFVLSSHHEGFPNALCEAMACGLPVVSFDCPVGPRNIIRDGIDGVLVPSGDLSILASEMSRLMADEELRQEMGARAAGIVSRFDSEGILNRWQSLLHRVVSGSGLAG